MKKILKIIIINIFFLTLFLITIEIFVRILKLSNLFGMDHACLDNKEKFLFKKNNICTVFDETVYTDSNGYRVPKINYVYYNSSSQVFIGDSVTFGNGILEEDTFVGLLRNQKKNSNIYNFSLPGFQLEDHFENLKKIKKIKNIQNIIYVFSINDVQKKNFELKDNNLKPAPKSATFFNYVNSFLRNKSHSYIFFKGILSDPSKRWFYYDFNYFKNNNNDNLKFFFEEAIKIAHSKKTNFIVILIPYEYQTRNNKCTNEYLYPQLELIKILNNLNVKYLNLINDFCTYKNPKDLFYKFDHMHLSKIGHTYIYNILKDIIKN